MTKHLFRIALLILILTSCTAKEAFFEDAICIENISTIDAKNGLKENQTIILKDGKIHKIALTSDLKLSPKNNIIDGRGKYLIPGLWDAHVHFAFMEELAPQMFDLFLAYGVTSVRDTGGKIDFVKQWKDKSLANPLSAPRVMIAGPLLDGMPNVYDGSDPWHPHLSTGLSSVDDVVSQVNLLDSLDVDLLKAYEMLSPEQFSKITELARAKGLKVTGHVPLSMDVIGTSNAGLNSMEHLRNLEMSCASNAAELLQDRIRLLDEGKNDTGAILRSRIHEAQRISAIENYDEKNAQKVFAVLAKNETWQIPTMALYRSTRLKENFEFMPSAIKTAWEKGLEASAKRKVQPERIQYAEWAVKMVGEIHKNKIEIMAGTDTPIGYLTPGLSLHEELSQLVSAGLTPLDALKTATLNPAKYFNLENELGWIGENTRADLLILNANPLENIAHTKEIHAVVKQGNYLDRKKLDKMLVAVSEK